MSTPLVGSRAVAIVATVTGAVLCATLPAAPALADISATGPGGQRLTVAKSDGVSRSGETVTVTGTGYDTDKGIYVAYCVDNGAGQLPTPCGGGVDMSGGTGSSHWISSNPPSYGEGLAVPYGPGGSFQVSIPLVTKIGDVDCTVRTCSVVTRADHTRTSDRSQDVRVPITFAAAAAPRPTSAAPRPSSSPAGGTSGGGGTASGSETSDTDAPDTGATTGPDGAGVADAGSLAPSAGAGSAVSGGPTATASDSLSVTRVSTVGPAGQWWSSTLILLALGVLALLGLTAARRRTRSRR
ncbi:hypothetical protein ACN27F_24160 [Solwaraspora sp. WMMB335]|uniref:hypothetical protein n=1 Tax=Solwaraspora sp. WMMB335 TaxID=3404118 RepID=UPI003B92C7B4